MGIYLPYIVVLAVILAFFGVCWLTFSTPSKKKEVVAKEPYYDSEYYKRSKVDYGALYYDSVGEGNANKTVTIAAEKSKLEATIPLRAVATEKLQEESSLGSTRILKRAELEEALAPTVKEEPSVVPVKVPEVAVGEAVKASSGLVTASMVDKGTAQFLHSFGRVSVSSRERLEEITEEAIARLAISSEEEWDALLDNIVIQEALECMQKAYVATPTVWMKATALEAFMDVVHEPKSSTPYLLAFDALHILPHLTLEHFSAMSMVLLLQYSRNSNNYSLENFRHYVTKYIKPFLKDLPKEMSYFKQLDYLRCLTIERDAVKLTSILSNSYPLVFNYRGFTDGELENVLAGDGMENRFVVDSINSSMYKLAFVDEALAPKFFREARITDEELQHKLLNLMKSKPTSFSGKESEAILAAIDPALVELNHIYDGTMLSSVGLTLLGLYLARAHVKALIGEEFDLSRWL